MDPGRWAAWREASRKLGRSAIARLGPATTTIHANAARIGTRLSAAGVPARGAAWPPDERGRGGSHRPCGPPDATPSPPNGSTDGRPTRRRYRFGDHPRNGRHRPDGRTARPRHPHTGSPTSARHRPGGRPAQRRPVRYRASEPGNHDNPREPGPSRWPAQCHGILALAPLAPDKPGPGGSHRPCGPPDATPPAARTAAQTGRPTRRRHHPGDHPRNGRRRPDGRAGRPRRARSGPADRPTQRRRRRNGSADGRRTRRRHRSGDHTAAAAIDQMTEQLDHAIRTAALQTARRNAAAARTAAQKAAQLDAATAAAATHASGRRRPDGRTTRPRHAHPGGPT